MNEKQKQTINSNQIVFVNLAFIFASSPLVSTSWMFGEMSSRFLRE